jgi:hypothetical protein
MSIEGVRQFKERVKVGIKIELGNMDKQKHF